MLFFYGTHLGSSELLGTKNCFLLGNPREVFFWKNIKSWKIVTSGAVEDLFFRLVFTSIAESFLGENTQFLYFFGFDLELFIDSIWQQKYSNVKQLSQSLLYTLTTILEVTFIDKILAFSKSYRLTTPYMLTPKPALSSSVLLQCRHINSTVSSDWCFFTLLLSQESQGCDIFGLVRIRLEVKHFSNSSGEVWLHSC